MTYNITIGNKTIEITESGYNILKAILDIEFSPPTVVPFFARLYLVNESPCCWSSHQSRFSQHGTNIFGEKLVTGSWSAQCVSNQCG